MAIPPHVTPDEGRAALARIIERHRRAGDEHVALDGEDPSEVLAYLRRLGSGMLLGETVATTEGQVEYHDITDALTVRLWLWWEGERHELWALQAAEKLRLSRRSVGAVLGIATSQGVADRVERKHAMLHPDRPAPGSPPAQTTPAPGSAAGQLREVVTALVAAASRLPADLADDLEDLRQGLLRWRTGRPIPDELAMDLRLLLVDLAQLDLDPDLRELAARAMAALVGR